MAVSSVPQAYEPFVIPVGGGAWSVQSSTDPSLSYRVEPDKGPGGSCECMDYQRRGGPCKHIRQARAERANLRDLLGIDRGYGATSTTLDLLGWGG